MVIPRYDLQALPEGAREESSGDEGLISIKLPEPCRKESKNGKVVDSDKENYSWMRIHATACPLRRVPTE